MGSCTCLVHECPKIHEDYTASIQFPGGLCMEVAQALCDFYAWLLRQHNDMERYPHSLSMALHGSVVESRQRYLTMAV